MEVLKRNGKREDVSFDKITARVKKLCYGLDSKFVDSIEISKRVPQWRVGAAGGPRDTPDHHEALGDQGSVRRANAFDHPQRD